MFEVLLGPNSILEGLRAGRRGLKGLYLLRGRRGEKITEILRLAEERGIPITWAERSQLYSLCKENRHQGVIAVVEAQKYFDLAETLAEVKKRNDPAFFLILDGVQDSGNMGSILRTAESAGIGAVIIPKDRAARLSQGTAKSSAGAQEYVKVVRVSNLAEAIKRIKEAGIWVVGADQQAEKVYYETDLRGPVALVIGGEGKGLRRLTRESCDLLVRIPMRGRVSCLNAGVAAGIMIFEILRQRE